MNDRHAFLRTLHPTGYRDLRAIRQGERPVLRNFQVDDLAGVDAFVSTYGSSHNLYTGVAVRDNPHGHTGKDCSTIHAMFTDLDFKDSPEADARARLAAFPLSPGAVIHSGGGLHVYVWLDEPINLREHRNFLAAGLILKALATALGGDLAAAEPARILRLPGTLNHKNDPRPVVLETFTEQRYSITDLLAVLPKITIPAARPEQPAVSATTPTATRIAMARSWLSTQPAGYQQGYRPNDPVQEGDNQCFVVCCYVVNDHDLSDGEAFDVLRDWNARCDPAWPDGELRAKIRSARKSARGPRGSRLVPTFRPSRGLFRLRRLRSLRHV